MRKIHFNLLMGLVLIVVTIISSCSKESKIEKNLWNKGGEWNIEKVVMTETSSYAPDNSEETIYNAGIWSFKEDGSGNISRTIPGYEEEIPFTYSNTEDKITLNTYGIVLVFNITEWKKDELTLTTETQSHWSNGALLHHDETIYLKKK